MSVSSFTVEEMSWSQQVATRLRLLQADFADLGPDERLPYFQQEIDRSLRDIPPTKRPRYLEALSQLFPIGAGPLRTTPPPSPAMDNSPEALVAALIQIAPKLPKRTLADFGLRLQQAGYGELKSTTLVDDPPPEFRELFPTAPSKPVDLQRLYRLALVFADSFLRLEGLSWKTWHQLAPNSRVHRDPPAASDLKSLGKRYLEGDTEVSAEQLKLPVEKTRQLISGVLNAIAGAGYDFSHSLAEHFSPEEILKSVKLESSGGFMAGFVTDEDKKCWRKYKQVYKDHSAPELEKLLRELFAESAEALMHGLKREEK